MINSNIQTLTLKEIVTDNFQAAAVFEKFSLDFCCRGGKTIEQACKEKGIDANVLLKELSSIASAASNDKPRFDEWDPDILAAYIVNQHHAYVRKMIPIINAHTQKVATVHGINHPEVIEIARHFETVAVEMHQHMGKEEQLLFPYIALLHEGKKKSTGVDTPPFGTVQNPIRMMEAEHQNAGDEMYAIRALSNGYTPPEDACTTYRVCYQELQDFERDLHEHIHLENNILFPAAVSIEKELFAKYQN